MPSPLSPPPWGPSKCKFDSLHSQERKRWRSNLTPTVEAVDECLSGSSVVDPLSVDCPTLTTSRGSEMPPVSSPWHSHTIATVGEIPPVSSPQSDSGPEAMLVSDPPSLINALAEGSEMPPVSSPNLGTETGATPASVSTDMHINNNNIGSGVTLVPVPTYNLSAGSGVTLIPVPSNNNNTGSGVTSSPVPSNNNNTGSGVTSTRVPNNNLVEGCEIPPVSSPLSRLETESTSDSLSQSSNVAAVVTNTGWETPRPFHNSLFPSVEEGDESTLGSFPS